VLKRLGRSFVIGEATVGVCLLMLLVFDVRDWIFYANVLTFAGATLLFAAAAPLAGIRANSRSVMPTRSLRANHGALAQRTRRWENAAAIIGQIVIALVVGGCSIVTAILFYITRFKA